VGTSNFRKKYCQEIDLPIALNKGEVSIFTLKKAKIFKGGDQRRGRPNLNYQTLVF